MAYTLLENTKYGDTHFINFHHILLHCTYLLTYLLTYILTYVLTYLESVLDILLKLSDCWLILSCVRR